MVRRSAGAVPAFHVMAKPRGPICNLDCSYCFYLRKEELFGGRATFRMADDVLERFVRQYIEGQNAPVVTFAWQGGEPTLMGLGFFRKVIRVQAEHARPGQRIENALQTNGILLDDEWAAFLRAHRFLVGLSMDGPADLHDANRVDRGHHPTHARVHAAMKLLLRHGVEFNVLCVVNRTNAEHPLRVYRYLRDEGARYLQLIPAVERLPGGGVTDWTVLPEQWGRFNIEVFDEWAARDIGEVFVQSFEAAIAACAGAPPGLCVHARTCGRGLAIEHTGDVYSCDHYVNGQHLLGNIRKDTLARMVASPFQRAFGAAKFDSLPRYCRECPVLFACYGGCPKDRFAYTPDGEAGLHYLCAGYRAFFLHAMPELRRIAAEVVGGAGA